MERVSVSLPIHNTPIARLRDMARWAEDAGFEAVFDYEICQNPFVALAAAATTTERIKLGTAIAVAFSRSPVVTAIAAADIDELSAGRMILGLGPGGEWHLSGMHSTTIANAVPRLREYVTAVRLAWDSLGTGKTVTYEGEHYRLRLDEGLHRTLARPQVPIYLAAMGSRKLMQLAGETAEGLLAFLYSPRYLKEVGRPNLEEGARRAGRDPAGVDLCSYVICCVSKDREEALRWARIQVGFYSFLPSSDPIIRYHGLEKEQAAVREAMAAQGPAALEHVTDQKLVDTFSVAGTPDECRRGLAEYRDLVSLPILHVPYFAPITAEESQAAYRNILETFSQ